jgi:hypothetical protein
MTATDPVVAAYRDAERLLIAGRIALGGLTVLHVGWSAGALLLWSIPVWGFCALTVLWAFLGAAVMHPWQDGLRRATRLHQEMRDREVPRRGTFNPSSN